MLDGRMLAEIYSVKQLEHFNIQKFLDSNYVSNKKVVDNLMLITYITNVQGHCWTSDLIELVGGDKKWRKPIEIGTYFMTQNRFIRVLEKHKKLGKKLEITNKGQFILDQYAAFLREQERGYFYRIKQNRKNILEPEENS